MNAVTNAHICLLNDFIRRALILISVVTPLSADAIKRLEDSREGWQHLRSHHFSDLLLMTELVAIGVILEGPELVYEIVQLVRRWHKKLAREHPPGWITVVGLLGWALVSVGVAGEFWVDSWVNTDDDNIQSINITLLRDAYSSASAAHDIAQGASDIAIPAKETAEKAKGEADSAKSRADAVGLQATALDRQLSAAKQDVASAKKELSSAEAAEKQEEQALSDMAVCLAPRVIPQNSYFNMTTKAVELSSVDPLRPHSGLQAIIDVAQDAEARRAASYIERSLRAAGWRKITVLWNVDGLRDGVEVVPWNPKELGNKELGTPEGDARLQRNLAAYRAVGSAADAIVDWLHSFNWYVTRGNGPNPDIPPDAIEIKVGLYPPVELTPSPGELPFAEIDAEMQKSREEAREKAEREEDEKVEEIYKTYPPYMAAKARAEWKQMREDEKRNEERYSQPCRLINPFNPALPVY